MFSSNQILEISGCLSDAEELKIALEFALSSAGYLKAFTNVTKADCKCVFQITKDGRYCIGYAYNKPETGWIEYPFDFDLSIIVDKNVSYFEIEKVIKDANMQYLKSYSLIDVYENEEKLKDKKNITIRFNIGSSDKTLTKEEIDEERIKLITNLGKYNMNING